MRSGGRGSPNPDGRYGRAQSKPTHAKGHSEQVDAGATPKPTRETRALPRGLEKGVLERRLKRAGVGVADPKLGTDFELRGAMDFHIELAALRHGSAYRLQRECRRIAIPAEVSKQNTLDFSRQQCLDHACGRCVRQMTVP